MIEAPIAAIIAPRNSIREPEKRPDSDKLRESILGGPDRMWRQVLWLLCCLLLIDACAAKKPNIGKVKATQRPYTVFGRRYEPLRSHEGFVQTGIASWYGRDFHGKPTSNGERYDMHAMTAAHKTLPLGVYVRVKNRDNGREAIVRVNDRGPFVRGRIIDLSFAAARKLGVDRTGTAPVRVEAIGFHQDGSVGRSRQRERINYDAGNYTVQIGAFRDYGNAQKLSLRMKKRFGFSRVNLTHVKGKRFYRVCAGRYTSLRAAEKAGAAFEDQGYPGSFAVGLD